MPKNKATSIYRIVHRDNLPIILEDKCLFAPNFGNSKEYISIGEEELIVHRDEIVVPVKPFGVLRDYVAFYFGVRSPMLYCIKNGFNVKKRPQEEIIYLVSSVQRIEKSNNQFVFTDGHAYAAFSMFFNNKNDLNQVDWNVVNSVRWNNTDSDSDRKRRKQAEFFVHKSVNLKSIIGVAVYNEESFDYVSNIISTFNSPLDIKILPAWYY